METKSHGNEVLEKIPKFDSNHTFLAVIILNSSLKKDDSYYPKVFLKEYKYIEKSSWTYGWQFKWLLLFFW